MSNKQILSDTISIIRFPMMMLVVLIHCNFSAENTGAPLPPVADGFLFLFAQTISRVAVPTFFFISGFLFFYNKDISRKFYIGALRKRVTTLLVPYILWNGFALLFKWFKTLPIISGFFPRMEPVDLTLSGILNAFGPFGLSSDVRPLGVYDPVGAPADMPLWFIRDLIAIVIFAPLVYRLMRGNCGKIVASLLIVLFLCGIWPERCFWFSLTGVTFFCLGSYFSINRKDLLNAVSFGGRSSMAFYSLSLLVVAAVSARLILRDSFWGYRALALYILCALPLFLLICQRLAQRGFRVMPLLSSGTFFMFALHGIVNSIFIKAVLQLLRPATSAGFIAAYILIATFLIAFCYLTYWSLRKISPRFVSILSGNR